MSDSWKIETKTVQCGYNPANGEPRVTPICQSTITSTRERNIWKFVPLQKKLPKN